MDPTILFENSDVVVINKPAGLVVHSDGKTKEPTVSEWMLKKYPESKGVGEPITLSSGEVVDRPGIVHRIDRDTSGILLLVKNQKAFEYFKLQFQGRGVEKTYHAFAYGEMKEEDGIIDRPIARSKKDFRLWSAQRGARGKEREAITEYKILERSKEFSFIEIHPKTGRTHQIRVHFKAINHPIVSDPLYAPKREQALGFSRTALHASEIGLVLPDGKKIKVRAPFPQDFEYALKELHKIMQDS